jgi:hypothetical protein
MYCCSEVRWSDHRPLSVVLSGRDTSSTDCCLVELEFIVSGGLGRYSTMTKLTVESLSRIRSTLLIPSFLSVRPRFYDPFISFSETQIQEILSYHDGSSSSTFLLVSDPVAAVDKSNAHITVSSHHALLPPSLMDIRNVS